MDDPIQFYDFSTPVHDDITLTAVWNDTPDPLNPTLENLRLALLTEDPRKYYPIGTEIPHTDVSGKSNPWVVMHYGTMNVVGNDGQDADAQPKFGAIVGLKYCDATALNYTYTNNNQLQATEMLPRFRDYWEKKVTAADLEYFSWVKTDYLGVRKLWMPLVANLTYTNAAVWDYYHEAAQYFNRVQMLGARSNATTEMPLSNQYFAAHASLKSVRYITARSYPTGLTMTEVVISTSTSPTYFTKYCAFVAAPDESPLNQPNEE